MSETYKHQQSYRHAASCDKFEDYGCGCGYCHDCGWTKAEHPVPAVPAQEAPREDRSMRVFPLAENVLYLLIREEDVEVRRAAVKLINIAEKHWPKEKRYGR